MPNNLTDPTPEAALDMTRRHFLGRGIGAAALAQLLARNGLAGDTANDSPVIGLPHIAARAKRVIFLTQSGGPSQLELYDEKPELMKWAGKELPESVRQGQRLTTMTASQKQLVMPSRARFRRCGESGGDAGELSRGGAGAQ